MKTLIVEIPEENRIGELVTVSKAFCEVDKIFSIFSWYRWLFRSNTINVVGYVIISVCWRKYNITSPSPSGIIEDIISRHITIEVGRSWLRYGHFIVIGCYENKTL